MNEGCADALNEYLLHRPDVDGEKAVFLSKQKRRISARRVQQVVDSAIERIGMGGRGLSTHKLRHTAATLMLHNGVDVRTLQELLGHDDITATQVYLSATKSRRRSSMNRCRGGKQALKPAKTKK